MYNDKLLVSIKYIPGLSPELRLWAAVLKLAVEDLQKNPYDQSALSFFFDENNIILPCFAEVLGITADGIRYRAKKLLKNP